MNGHFPRTAHGTTASHLTPDAAGDGSGSFPEGSPDCPHPSPKPQAVGGAEL